MNGLTCMSFQNTDREENSTERNKSGELQPESCMGLGFIFLSFFFFFTSFSSLRKLCAAEESFHRLRSYAVSNLVER